MFLNSSYSSLTYLTALPKIVCMSEYNTVAEEIKANKEKLKGHTPWEKIKYFFFYNKWIFIGLVATALLLFFLIRAIIVNSKETYVSGVFINSYALAMTKEEYEGAYADAVGADQGTYKVSFDTSLTYDSVEGNNSTQELTTPIMVIAYSEAADTDFFLCNSEDYDFFAQNGYFIDLREVLPASLLEQLTTENRIHYMTYEGSTEQYPIAVSLDPSNAPYLWDTALYTEHTQSLLFSVFYTSSRKDKAAEFLSFLLEPK